MPITQFIAPKKISLKTRYHLSQLRLALAIAPKDMEEHYLRCHILRVHLVAIRRPFPPGRHSKHLPRYALEILTDYGFNVSPVRDGECEEIERDLIL